MNSCGKPYFRRIGAMTGLSESALDSHNKTLERRS